MKCLLVIAVLVPAAFGQWMDATCGTSIRTPFCEQAGLSKDNPQPASFVVGGTAALRDELGWQVGLVSTAGASTDDAIRNKQVFCGGSILNENWVITAAHCVSGRAIASLKIVSNRLVVGDSALLQDVHSVTVINVNADYGSVSIDHDTATIRVDPPFNFARAGTTPVCPPDAVDQYVGARACTSGWGTTSEGGAQSNTLLYAGVDIVSNSECSIAYPVRLNERMVCAAFPGRDACQGDSGGPLITHGADGRADLIGIVSWGNGCARAGSPGVYARVSAFLEWIAVNAP